MSSGMGKGSDLGATCEWIDEFVELGARAFVTTRATGNLSLHSAEAVGAVMERWHGLRAMLAVAGPGGRFATVGQVHGNRVVAHEPGWDGWLRVEDADGHFDARPGTAFAITVADCVPVFVMHSSGAAALVHAGWRGTASGILGRAIEHFSQCGLAAADLRVHLGPAICGRCYEVGSDVFGQLTGRRVERPALIDLRALLAEQASSAGVRSVSQSPWCTRCHSDRFYSHRAGDAGRQVAVLLSA